MPLELGGNGSGLKLPSKHQLAIQTQRTRMSPCLLEIGPVANHGEAGAQPGPAEQLEGTGQHVQALIRHNSTNIRQIPIARLERRLAELT